LDKINERTSSVAARICEAPENLGGCAVARAHGPKPPMTSHLTASEKKVLALITLAKSNKEIAVSLCISPATVKRHVENLLRKLELRNRVEAAIYGLMLAGCPRGINAECPLAMWHREKSLSAPNWAD
jgi:DNA-binding NarL/FixJ family response regulator